MLGSVAADLWNPIIHLEYLENPPLFFPKSPHTFFLSKELHLSQRKALLINTLLINTLYFSIAYHLICA